MDKYGYIAEETKLDCKLLSPLYLFINKLKRYLILFVNVTYFPKIN